MTLKFAANLSFMFTEVPFPQRFQAAAHAGFTAMEFLFPYDHTPNEIRQFATEAGVQIALHNLPPGNWDAGDRGLAGRVGCQDAFRASVETGLRYADATGVRQIHIMAGCVAVADRKAAEEVYIENLSHAARRFADAGLTALIEPINTTDMPGYLLNHVDDACRVIRTLDQPNLRMQFDCYHAQIMEGDAREALERCYHDIGHIQIASVPDRHEPDHGVCDYTAIFDVLQARQYSGWIGCEYHPASQTELGLCWIEGLR